MLLIPGFAVNCTNIMRTIREVVCSILRYKKIPLAVLRSRTNCQAQLAHVYTPILWSHHYQGWILWCRGSTHTIPKWLSLITLFYVEEFKHMFHNFPFHNFQKTLSSYCSSKIMEPQVTIWPSTHYQLFINLKPCFSHWTMNSVRWGSVPLLISCATYCGSKC